MKKMLTLIVGLALTASTFAQTANDYIEVARDVLHTEKKAAVAEGMMLDESQTTSFWALYNEYQSKLYTVHTKRVNIIQDFASNYENLSEEKADELINASFSYQMELLKLQQSYYKKFKKELGAGVAARYMQMESKIETLIDANLAIEIPLVPVK